MTIKCPDCGANLEYKYTTEPEEASPYGVDWYECDECFAFWPNYALEEYWQQPIPAPVNQKYYPTEENPDD